MSEHIKSTTVSILRSLNSLAGLHPVRSATILMAHFLFPMSCFRLTITMKKVINETS